MLRTFTSELHSPVNAAPPIIDRGFSVIMNSWVLDQVELGISRLDAQEEAVARHRRKLVNVEQRVIRHGQSVQSEHAKYSRQSGEQHRQLERRNDKCRPGIVRPPADVQRIVDHVDPILQARMLKARPECRPAARSAARASCGSRWPPPPPPPDTGCRRPSCDTRRHSAALAATTRSVGVSNSATSPYSAGVVAWLIC